jgi:hypothetical protein
VPLVDLIDETFVVAPPAALAARLRRPELWREWWPALDLVVFQDRGQQGVRWTVTGALVGTSEIWLEPVGDGTLVHYYLRADPTRRGSATEPVEGPPARLARLAQRVGRAHAVAVKARVNALKDEMERGREPGMPPGPLADRPGPARAAAVKDEANRAET